MGHVLRVLLILVVVVALFDITTITTLPTTTMLGKAYAHPVSHMCTGLFHADPFDGCGDPSSVFSQSGTIIWLSALAMALSVSMLYFRKYYLPRKDFYTVR